MSAAVFVCVCVWMVIPQRDLGKSYLTFEERLSAGISIRSSGCVGVM